MALATSATWRMTMKKVFPLPLNLASPLNFWKTFCGVICLMDCANIALGMFCAKFHPSATNAVVAIHLCHPRIRTYDGPNAPLHIVPSHIRVSQLINHILSVLMRVAKYSFATRIIGTVNVGRT